MSIASWAALNSGFPPEVREPRGIAGRRSPRGSPARPTRWSDPRSLPIWTSSTCGVSMPRASDAISAALARGAYSPWRDPAVLGARHLKLVGHRLEHVLPAAGRVDHDAGSRRAPARGPGVAVARAVAGLERCPGRDGGRRAGSAPGRGRNRPRELLAADDVRGRRGRPRGCPQGQRSRRCARGQQSRRCARGQQSRRCAPGPCRPPARSSRPCWTEPAGPDVSAPDAPACFPPSASTGTW